MVAVGVYVLCAYAGDGCGGGVCVHVRGCLLAKEYGGQQSEVRLFSEQAAVLKSLLCDLSCLSMIIAVIIRCLIAHCLACLKSWRCIFVKGTARGGLEGKRVSHGLYLEKNLEVLPTNCAKGTRAFLTGRPGG